MFQNDSGDVANKASAEEQDTEQFDSQVCAPFSCASVFSELFLGVSFFSNLVYFYLFFIFYFVFLADRDRLTYRLRLSLLIFDPFLSL